MDLRLFDALYPKTPLCQNKLEWRAYMEFIDAYFRNRGIERPVIVELGIERGGQKKYYCELLDAQHIGIDIGAQYYTPDILGDAFSAETIARLQERLAGRPINLLFLDVDSRESNEALYRLYEPMVENIIAMHSIAVPKSIAETNWRKLCDERDGYMKITIQAMLPEGHQNYITNMGIGLVIKK